jgi:hypothetical protein
MALGQSMVDAVDAAAVTARIGNELLCPAYSAVVQDYPSPEVAWSLKIVPTGLGSDGYGSSRLWVTIGLGPFSRLNPIQGWRPPGASTANTPVKGCWLARSHRHSTSHHHADSRLVSGCPKGKIVHGQCALSGRDSGAWYRAVRSKNAGPCLEKWLSCQPVSSRTRGFKSHSRRHNFQLSFFPSLPLFNWAAKA